MPDREKVIKGLECCLGDTRADLPNLCTICPYAHGSYATQTCGKKLREDALALLKAQEPITGETSDGYHTFNELYHHRAVLFSVIVANYKDRAWKSVRHHDGTMYDGMFIVGIDTPDGQATYHYDIDPYWDMFDCKVREFAPEWDGHTPAQAIERIGKLKAQEPRVMTPEEVVGCVILKRNITLWFEFRNEIKAMNAKDIVYNDFLSDEDFQTLADPNLEWVDGGKRDGVIIAEYNDTFRCWTSRPTDEQREKEPWNG